jgi:hypothetical protein
MVRIVRVDHSAKAQVRWVIGSPTPGVVLVDVKIGNNSSVLPLHWRTGDWTKPPLDVELDPNSGEVLAVQFVLQDERVPRQEVEDLPDVGQGVPLFDIRGWPADRYSDFRQLVRVVRSKVDEMVLSIGSDRAVAGLSIDGRLMFAHDQSCRLCEIRIGPLSSEEWTTVDTRAFIG